MIENRSLVNTSDPHLLHGILANVLRSMFIFSLDKDVARTDRAHEYFQGDNNVHVEILHNVLMTYNMFNYDLGTTSRRACVSSIGNVSI